MKSNSIKKIILFLWIALSIFLAMTGIKNGINYILMLIIGQIIVLLGLSNVFKNLTGWFLIDIGLGFMCYPFSEIIGIKHIVSSNPKDVVLFFGILVAMQLFFDDSFRNKRFKKRCTTPYPAKCISFEQAEDSTYIPVYKYSIEGKTEMYYGNRNSTVNPKLGDVITVFVNKKNEKEVYCPTSKAILMFRYLIGAIVLAFSTGAIIVL